MEKSMIKNKKKKYGNLTVDFLVNNLMLEGMQSTEEEKIIYKNILEGKIDLNEYKKAVLA